MIPQGVEIFIAVDPVDMRYGFDRLSGLVRERMKREPRSTKAVFVFFGKTRHSIKVLGWDGTGAIIWYKRLDRGVFEVPRPREPGAQSVIVSDAVFTAMFAGLQPMRFH